MTCRGGGDKKIDLSYVIFNQYIIGTITQFIQFIRLRCLRSCDTSVKQQRVLMLYHVTLLFVVFCLLLFYVSNLMHFCLSNDSFFAYSVQMLYVCIYFAHLISWFLFCQSKHFVNFVFVIITITKNHKHQYLHLSVVHLNNKCCYTTTTHS